MHKSIYRGILFLVAAIAGMMTMRFGTNFWIHAAIVLPAWFLFMFLYKKGD
jgi:hypothetical protein